MDVGDKLRQFQNYVKDLEEELYKIMVFKREFPLSIQLVSHQIHSCRMIIGDENPHPEEFEFISLKPTFSSSSEKESPQKRMLGLPIKPITTITKKFGGAFHPFEKEKLTLSTAAEASLEDKDGEEEEGKSQSSKKRRRYWSSDLHHRFMDALQQLGGSDVATPKQIRELMQIDNLTNDEVKSHLQKYRLHTKRPPPAIESSSSQAPQFLVVGNIWFPSAVPQPNEESGAPVTGIYAPIASKPALSPSLNGSLHYDGATNSASHTSSSSQTITT